MLYTNEDGDETRLIQLTEVVKFDECDPQTQEANDGGKLRAEVDGFMQFSGFTAAEERDFLLSRAIKHSARHEPNGEDPMTVDAVAGTGSLRTLGTGAQQACAGNDPRLSDARTPSLHGETHGERGTDPVLIELSQVAGLVDWLDVWPAWYRCTVNHTQIAVASSVASVTLFTLPARGAITSTIVRVKVPFRKNTKGGPTTVTCSVGTTTSPTRWSDVQEVGPGAVAENAFMAQRATDSWSGNFNSSINVQAQFFCDLGINLNVLEQGTVEIYILWAAQPN